MKFKDLHPNVKIRIGTGFFRRIFNDMVTPFMAVYLTVHFGAGLSGVMMASIVLCGILASLYGGYYADQKGRKQVLVVTELLNFLCLLCMSLFNSPWAQFPLLTFCCYFVKNIAFTISTPAGDAMMIDVSTTETRKFIYSIGYWVNNLSFAVGAILGAFLYQNYFFQVLLSSAFGSLGILIVYACFVEESMPQIKPIKKAGFRWSPILASYRLVLQDRIFLKFIVSSILAMGIEYQLGNYISVRLAREFGVQKLFAFFPLTVTGINMYGILRAENTFGVVVLSVLLGRVFRLLNDRQRLYIGTVLFTGGYMVVGVSNLGWLLVMSTLVFTLGELLYMPIKQALLAELVRDEARTQYLAVYNLHYRGAQILASFCITLGAVLPSWGMSFLFGCMGVGGILIYVNLMKARHSSKAMNQFSS